MKTQLIYKFHQVELDNKLFEIGKEVGIPLWDIIRYTAFRNLNYPEKDRTRLSQVKQKKTRDYLLLIKEIFKHIFLLPFKKSDIIIFSNSRYLSPKKNEYYDKSALPIIKNLCSKYLVIESQATKRAVYPYVYDLSNFVRRFYRKRNYYKQQYNSFKTILEIEFGSSLISESQFYDLIRVYKSQYFYYKAIFYLLKPKKIVICTGNPKALVKAAKHYGIESYLVQHAGIELDEIDYSYPSTFRQFDLLLFPDYLLTFGDYWCRDINVPVKKIIPVGNDYFSELPLVETDESIIFISTIVHGYELSNLCCETSRKWPCKRFIYKLHPNEYHFKNEYKKMFSAQKNISVLTDEEDINILIARSNLVVLIVSAVLYTALQQGKKVAVYKRINWERQLLVENTDNLFFFDTIEELYEIDKIKVVKKRPIFFEQTNNAKIRELFCS